VARQPDAGVAHGFKRLAQACGCALGGGGGVVEFMRQTGGELTQGHHLVALRLDARGLADAVGHDGDQSLAKQGNALQHLREVAPVQGGNARGKHGPAGAAVSASAASRAAGR
jgi:hypothetical protein